MIHGFAFLEIMFIKQVEYLMMLLVHLMCLPCKISVMLWACSNVIIRLHTQNKSSGILFKFQFLWGPALLWMPYFVHCPTLDSTLDTTLTLDPHWNLDTWMNDLFCLDISNTVSAKAISGLLKFYWCNLRPGVALSTQSIYLQCRILPSLKTWRAVKPTFYNMIAQR